MDPDQQLSGTYLCTVEITLQEGGPLQVGQTPWRNRRISNITGGAFDGPRMNGTVLPSGADWAESGMDGEGNATSFLDIRSVWQTDDDALIYVTYAGRLVIPQRHLETFKNLKATEALDPSEYYFRIAPTFETSAPQYGWLNNVLAVGLGQRLATGVRYDIFAVD